MDLDVGTRLGAYAITARIDAGVLGEVWRARDTRLVATWRSRFCRTHSPPIASAGPTFEAGTPEALFPVRIATLPFKFQYAVSQGGRFLINSERAEDAAGSPITVILNWRP